MAHMFCLAGTRPDGKPALGFNVAKATALLTLGAWGTIWKLEGITNKDDQPFVPLDPMVWNQGQCPTHTRMAIMAAIEAGATLIPVVKVGKKK